MGADFSLTEEEIKLFKTQGYLGPFTLYSEEEMAGVFREVRAKLFNRTNAIYDIPVDNSIANYDRHLDLSRLSQHVARPEIVGRVRSLLGKDLICWRSEFFPKYPGDEGTDWHQADTFAHASGKPQIVWPENEKFGGTITVWTAFTEASIENGCLQFIPGTHEEMYYDEEKAMTYDASLANNMVKDGKKRGFFGYDYRSLQKDPNWKPDESRAVSLVMRPGQFVIFWSTLMHASHPNASADKLRLGYACRYVPSCVDIYPDTDHVTEYGGSFSLEKYGTVLVSGDNRNSRNRIRDTNTLGEKFEVLA